MAAVNSGGNARGVAFGPGLPFFNFGGEPVKGALDSTCDPARRSRRSPRLLSVA